MIIMTAILSFILGTIFGTAGLLALVGIMADHNRKPPTKDEWKVM